MPFQIGPPWDVCMVPIWATIVMYMLHLPICHRRERRSVLRQSSLRYVADTQPACPLHVTGTQPFWVAPRTLNRVPSGSTVMTPAVSDAAVRQFNPPPPVPTTTPEVDVVGGGVGTVDPPEMRRKSAEAHPACPAQVIGTQPACVAPRTGTVVPSDITVIIAPEVEPLVRQRNPAPPV